MTVVLLHVGDQRDLTDGLARSDDIQRHLMAVRVRRIDSELARRDPVQPVALVALRKKHRLLTELPAMRHVAYRGDRGRRQSPEQELVFQDGTCGQV